MGDNSIRNHSANRISKSSSIKNNLALIFIFAGVKVRVRVRAKIGVRV